MTVGEYAELVKNQTPREAYLNWKALQQNRPLAQIESDDSAMDNQRDPFSREDKDALAMGRSMYVAHCAACHGMEAGGRGVVPEPDPQRMSFHNAHKQAYIKLFGHAPDSWYTTIANGPADNEKIAQTSARMPAFGKILANEQIRLLITYLEQETLHPGFATSK